MLLSLLLWGLAGPVGAASLAASSSYSVSIHADSTLWAWGDNSHGQLGDGSTLNHKTPVRIGSITTWTSVVAGNAHTLALRPNGMLWTWGYNQYGQLGDGTTTVRLAPVQIGTANSWAQVSAGVYHSAALHQDGTLWAWDNNQYSPLGQFAGTPPPLAVDPELAPLPVSLVAFTAQRLAPRTPHMTWTSASEVRNAGFWVERSLDGVAFEALGFEVGAGSRVGARSYGYEGAVPSGTTGAYYCLRQVNTIGSPLSTCRYAS